MIKDITMSSLFKMPSMPAPPQLEMPKVENVTFSSRCS